MIYWVKERDLESDPTEDEGEPGVYVIEKVKRYGG
jgi:hypothetical protein